MRLILPNKKYARSWAAASKEFEKEKIFGSWYNHNFSKKLPQLIAMFKDFSKGKNLPKGYVPETNFWLIDKNQYIGSIDIRHKLSPFLKIRGGHIGYAIRPSAWGKGYGSHLLRLGLKKALALNLKKVLITCDDANIPSLKIIEKNGGQLKEKATVDGTLIRRYWIKL